MKAVFAMYSPLSLFVFFQKACWFSADQFVNQRRLADCGTTDVDAQLTEQWWTSIFNARFYFMKLGEICFIFIETDSCALERLMGSIVH